MKDILVVEDDLDIYEIIKIYLLNEGYRIHHASNHEEVLESLNLHSIDLILLDFQLPGMNGFEICMKIRESFQMPIIFLSGKAEEKLVEKSMELGANDYMFKPFIPNELVKKVHSYLQ